MVAVVVGALVAGCASPAPAPSSPTTSGTPTPSAELVGWVDGVCRARQDSSWNPPPPVHTTALTEADRAAVVAYLSGGRDHFTQVLASLDALGESPVEGGDEVVATMRTTLNELAGTLGEYARNAGLFPAPDFGAPYRLGLGEIATWSFGSPSLDDLAVEDPVVAAAEEQAASC